MHRRKKIKDINTNIQFVNLAKTNVVQGSIFVNLEKIGAKPNHIIALILPIRVYQ
jgi:hypothetical protein